MYKEEQSNEFKIHWPSLYRYLAMKEYILVAKIIS